MKREMCRALLVMLPLMGSGALALDEFGFQLTWSGCG